MRKINDIALAEIERLRAEGIEPTAAEIVEIHELSQIIATPETRQMLAKGTPVRLCDGVHLWPLTLAADDWWLRVGERCTDSEAALAYAMVHGDRQELAYATESDVKQWRDKLPVTRAQVSDAIAQVTESENVVEMPPTRARGDHSPGAISALAMALHGGTPEMWERAVRLSYITELFEAAYQAGSDKPTPDDRRIKAQAAMLWATQKMREARKHG